MYIYLVFAVVIIILFLIFWELINFRKVIIGKCDGNYTGGLLNGFGLF